ncbi:hypothetical protein DFH09DRAFT_1091665 [Mycena vulgaris]|nr:hypothetical protein DFH09DRAFT_1091665 [Mycena vulgaris]
MPFTSATFCKLLLSSSAYLLISASFKLNPDLWNPGSPNLSPPWLHEARGYDDFEVGCNWWCCCHLTLPHVSFSSPRASFNLASRQPILDRRPQMSVGMLILHSTHSRAIKIGSGFSTRGTNLATIALQLRARDDAADSA